MSDSEIKTVADTADMIVCGYAFTKCDLGFRVLNLHDTNKAVVISDEGEVLETSMNDIEISIVKKYYNRNKELLGDN